VDVRSLTPSGQVGGQIMALRMAPDSVRAALLVRMKSGTKSATELLLAAPRFGTGGVGFGQPVSIGALPSNAHPLAISWLDAYHLAVLGDNGVIYTMPLTGGVGIQPGGSPQTLVAAPGGAQTLTTDGSELVVGAVDNGANRIWAYSPASGWALAATTGEDPVYPG
jgi:hypothetical protein